MFRRQAGQGIRKPSHPDLAFCIGNGRQAGGLTFRLNEMIDGIERPGFVAHLRNRGVGDGLEGPVRGAGLGLGHRDGFLRPGCPSRDPVAQQGDLLGRQALALRRHALALVGGGDSIQQAALLRFAGDEGVATRIRLGQGAGLAVVAQAAVLFVRSMALQAVRFEDRLDVAVEIGGGVE